MATLVSTGQLSIIDTNDARSITASFTSGASTQQVYTKDESTISYTPSWFSTPLVLTPKISIGGMTEANVWAALTNKTFALTQGGAALAVTTSAADFANNSDAAITNSFAFTHGADGTSTVSTLSVIANLKASVGSMILFFDADFTDPVSLLVTHITCQITINTIKTGTNATYVMLRTPQGTVLEPNKPISPVSTIQVYADLIRANGIDNTGVTYKWFQSPHAAADQIDGNLASVTTKYGLLDSTAIANSKSTTVGNFATGATPTLTAITTANVPDGTYGDYKGLLIHNSAVTDVGVFKVEARDADGTVYQEFFTLTDVSDPFDVVLVSTGGDKMQNGIGSTDVYPIVKYGQTKITNLTSWTFRWYFYQVDAVGTAIRGGFVDTTRTAVATGRNITANTTTTFTHDGANIAFVAGDLIKAVLGTKSEVFEVASVSTTTVTVRSPTTNIWVPAANFTGLTANEFLNGKLFVLKAFIDTTGANANDLAAKITLTGYDIDGKGNVVCEANKP